MVLVTPTDGKREGGDNSDINFIVNSKYNILFKYYR